VAAQGVNENRDNTLTQCCLGTLTWLVHVGHESRTEARHEDDGKKEYRGSLHGGKSAFLRTTNGDQASRLKPLILTGEPGRRDTPP